MHEKCTPYGFILNARSFKKLDIHRTKVDIPIVVGKNRITDGDMARRAFAKAKFTPVTECSSHMRLNERKESIK